MSQTFSISAKMLLFLTYYSSKYPEINESWFPQNNNNNQHNFSILIIRSVSCHHIRMISEGSCTTEDWSNDAENAGINYILT